MDTLGKRLKLIRAHLQINQTVMAETGGVSQSIYSHYEKDDSIPSAMFIHRICENYGINANWLLSQAGNMFINGNPRYSNYNKDKIDVEQFGAKIPQHLRDQVRAIENRSNGNGISSNGAGAGHNNAIEDYLTRSLWGNSVEMPILGEIAAGEPMPLPEELGIDQLIKIPGVFLTDHPGSYIALRINGNSMEPVILHSELVIIHRETDWDRCENRIVAVRISTDTTLKRLEIVQGIPMLLPFNNHYKPILLTPDYHNGEVLLIGRLVLQLRYHP